MSRLLCRLAGVLLAAGLAVLCAVPAHAADLADGDLRLRGGPSHNEGRLEIFHDDEWGTVCDDFFGRRDAKVACKQMDYTGAAAFLTDVAVAPGRQFWLDDVNCVGDEAKLTECFYNSNVRNSSSRTSPQWGFANCIPSEQVGVRCTASTTDKSVELNESHLTVQEQGGGSRYTVRLGKAPTGNVTVAISGQSSTVTVDSTPLTFTTGNWSTPQTVTLTAFDDSNRTDDSFTLTHTASGGGYGSVTASLSVTVEDDDGPVQAHIDSGGIVSLTEGSSRTYRIWLDSAPTEQVTVAVTAPSKVSVNPTSMTFTTGNWSTPQTVTLEASHDNDTSDETQYVTHRATKGGYTTTLSRVQVEITDDDDGEDQIGSRPSGALWWAALTARREGEGSFDDGAGDGGGTVQSSLTSVFPYARLAIGDGLDIWGLIGVGSGDLTLAVGEEVTRTDLSMRMGALGLRGEIVTAEEEGDFGLAWKSDALWVRTESAASRSSTGGNLEAASGDVSRVRVTMEGSRAFAAGPGSAVTPTLEIGLRHDGGDAETGAGVEAGFGLEYSNPAQGLTVEGRVRGLLAHTDGAYEEWGASGSLRLDPGISGRGVSLTVAPVWGAASGGVEQLWSTGTAAGLAADDAFDAQARLQAELGYGRARPWVRGC